MPPRLPLTGVRVVSLALNLPGPLAAARLCGLGADVLKVEPPAGDLLALGAPDWYAELTSGQRVLMLDLKSAGGRADLDTHLAQADMLITAMRPSALARLGLADAHLRFPRLSLVEIVGHDGEQGEQPGHDLTYQAVHGTLAPPVMPTVPVVDMLGAERAVSAALLALRERDHGRGGAGYHHRVVLEDAARAAGAAVRHGLTGQGGLLGGADPAYGIYPSADGHVALAAIEPHFRDRLGQSLGGAHSREELERVFAARPTSAWEALAAQADLPLAAVRAARTEAASGR